MDRNINSAAARAAMAAGKERLESPATVQNSNAVRHGSSGKDRLAVCTVDAGESNTITANLIHPLTGVVQTTGDEANVTVYCNISGGTKLNEASRLLATGDVLSVKQHMFDNAGTPEKRWYAVEGFDSVEECECTEPT